MSSLHFYRLSAERLSENVEVLIVDEREFEFGYMKASYQFERRCETGKAAGKLFPENLFDIIIKLRIKWFGPQGRAKSRK